MKIRTDFVTNSSSSSFILAFNSEQEMATKMMKEISHNNRVTTVLYDIARMKPLSEDELKRRINEEAENYADNYLTFGLGCWWSREKDTFENKWLREHPKASYSDMRESNEYKEAFSKRKDEFAKEFYEKLGNRKLVYEVEYGDDCDGDLEQYIVPEFEFTVASFNHH